MAERQSLEEIARQRENKRNTHLEILKDEVMQDFFGTSYNLLEDISGQPIPGKLDFGSAGRNASYNLHKFINKAQAESSDPNPNVAKALFALHYNALSNERSPVSAVLTEKDTLEGLYNFYLKSVDYVKVKDMLGLRGIEEYKDLSEQELNMYMEDFKVANKGMYEKIRTDYSNSIGRKAMMRAQQLADDFDKIKLGNDLSAKTNQRLAEEAKRKAQASRAA